MGMTQHVDRAIGQLPRRRHGNSAWFAAITARGDLGFAAIANRRRVRSQKIAWSKGLRLIATVDLAGKKPGTTRCSELSPRDERPHLREDAA